MKTQIILTYNWKTKLTTKYNTTSEAAKALGLNEPEVYTALGKRQVVGDYSFSLTILNDLRTEDTN